MSRMLPVSTHSGYFRLAMVTILCVGTFPAALSAQQAKPSVQSAAPVPLVVAPQASPQVQPDGSATFRLAMPHATKVALNLEGVADPYPMTQGPDGVWIVTVPKLAPEYYSYT